MSLLRDFRVKEHLDQTRRLDTVGKTCDPQMSDDQNTAPSSFQAPDLRKTEKILILMLILNDLAWYVRERSTSLV